MAGVQNNHSPTSPELRQNSGLANKNANPLASLAGELSAAL
jgi:hypothetical protein